MKVNVLVVRQQIGEEPELTITPIEVDQYTLEELASTFINIDNDSFAPPDVEDFLDMYQVLAFESPQMYQLINLEISCVEVITFLRVD